VTPLKPEVFKVEWNAYTGFPVTGYTANVEPGSRAWNVDSTTTSATFVDLSWGEDYTVVVTAHGEGDQTATSGVIEIPGTKLNAEISKARAVRGSNIVVSGTLRWADDSPIANAKIWLQAAYLPLKYKYFDTGCTGKTGSKGRFSITCQAERNAVYRALFLRPGTAGGWDGAMDLAVTVPISLRFSNNPINLGQRVRFSGAVGAPAEYVEGSLIRLQERVNGRWVNRTATTVTASSTYSMYYKPTSRTDRAWRVWTEAGDSFATSASPPKTLVVR
jgi:hypothetical protein